MRKAAALLVLLLAPAAFAERASADFTHIEIVQAVSASSSASKFVGVVCPPGMRVVGAGGDASAGVGEYAQRVTIDAIRPGPQLNGVTVRAREDEVGTTQNWVVQAFAVCAIPPAGLELVTQSSASSSAAKSVVAACPAGKRLLGAGGEVTGPLGQVILDGILPDLGLTRATVNGLEDETGTTSAWTVTSYAICSNPVRGLQRVATTSAANSAAKPATASCPAGKTMLGAAGTINSANGQVLLDSIVPVSDPAWAAVRALEDGTGNAGNWSLTAYAICASAARLVTTTSPTLTTSTGAQPAACPEGMESTGLGGEIGWGDGLAWLRVMRAMNDLSSTEMVGSGGESDGWDLTAHAICRSKAAGTTIAAAAGEPVATESQSVTATCPDGTRVVGAVGNATGTQSSDVSAFVHVTAVRPDAALRSVTVKAEWFNEISGSVGAWRPVAWAICAPPPAGLQRTAASSTETTDAHAYTVAECPAGKHLIGLGGEIVGNARLKGFDDLAPDLGLTRVSVVATDAGSRRYRTPWSVTAYGICVNR